MICGLTARDPRSASCMAAGDGRTIGPIIRINRPDGGSARCNASRARAQPRRREVASDVGLAPTPYNSSTMVRDQGISKAGNRRARAVAIELAWIWLRNQPQSKLSRWFRTRVGDSAGRVRRIPIVALARKLIVALWHFLEAGVIRRSQNKRVKLSDQRKSALEKGSSTLA
jgi:hypothetical protein